ncbi:MAG: hydantoinase/oxoprolinase N-terminal domain-containing protein [bacterium]
MCRVSDIGLVSLSTTLATNSLVEKKGMDPGVVLIGFSDDMEKRSHLKDLVSQERILRIPGGHRYDGSEKKSVEFGKASTISGNFREIVKKIRGSLQLFSTKFRA